MEFGNLVKLKRTKQGLTLAELELSANVSSSFISRIENNTQKSPSASNVFKLAKALNITSDELEQCFSTKLDKNTEANDIKLIKQTDYVLIKQGEEVLCNIANNSGNYDDNIENLVKIARRLKKEQVHVVCSLHDVDYVVNVRVYDKYIVEEIKHLLKDSFGGRIRVIEGYFIENDEENLFEVREFIEHLIDCDGIEEDEVEDLKEYLNKINY